MKSSRTWISIHAPREGGDIGKQGTHRSNNRFQSTPPARGATSGYQYEDLRLVVISIHAPREGGDLVDVLLRIYHIGHFNPRPPRGGRRY